MLSRPSLPIVSAFIRNALGAVFTIAMISPTARGSEEAIKAVAQTPGLVAFWTFGEDAGQGRCSSATKEKFPLEEIGGPVARIEGGVFSGYSAQFDGHHYFRIPHAALGGLHISGKNAQVSMVAVVKVRCDAGDRHLW